MIGALIHSRVGVPLQYMRFLVREVGAEDALGLGIEVVGSVSQVVGEAEDGAIVSDENVAARAIDGDGFAPQITQGGGVVDLTNGKSTVGMRSRS